MSVTDRPDGTNFSMTFSSSNGDELFINFTSFYNMFFSPFESGLGKRKLFPSSGNLNANFLLV